MVVNPNTPMNMETNDSDLLGGHDDNTNVSLNIPSEIMEADYDRVVGDAENEYLFSQLPLHPTDPDENSIDMDKSNDSDNNPTPVA